MVKTILEKNRGYDSYLTWDDECKDLRGWVRMSMDEIQDLKSIFERSGHEITPLRNSTESQYYSRGFIFEGVYIELSPKKRRIPVKTILDRWQIRLSSDSLGNLEQLMNDYRIPLEKEESAEKEDFDENEVSQD